MSLLKIVKAMGQLLLMLENNRFGAVVLISLAAITAVASIATVALV